MHTCTLASARVRTRMHAQTSPSTDTCTHPHTCTYTRTHVHTHTHTHTHLHHLLRDPRHVIVLGRRRHFDRSSCRRAPRGLLSFLGGALGRLLLLCTAASDNVLKHNAPFGGIGAELFHGHCPNLRAHACLRICAVRMREGEKHACISQRTVTGMYVPPLLRRTPRKPPALPCPPRSVRAAISTVRVGGVSVGVCARARSRGPADISRL